MLSMAVQPGISGGAFTQTSLPFKTLTFKPFKSTISSVKPKSPSLHSYKSLDSKQIAINSRRREVILFASATSVEEEADIDDGLLTVINENEVEANKVEENKVGVAKPLNRMKGMKTQRF